jgi:ABC-type uncharacterized transport system substrate-binding protein
MSETQTTDHEALLHDLLAHVHQHPQYLAAYSSIEDACKEAKLKLQARIKWDEDEWEDKQKLKRQLKEARETAATYHDLWARVALPGANIKDLPWKPK